MTSEYVRQELRAIVGARQSNGGSSGSVGMAVSGQQRQLQLGPGQSVSAADLEALGFVCEPPSTGTSDSPKLWGGIGSDLSSGSPQAGFSSSRNPTEESPRPGDHKSSLLQKLLSE